MSHIVPLNISGIWCPVHREDIKDSGSIGLSLVLNSPIIVIPKKGGKSYF